MVFQLCVAGQGGRRTRRPPSPCGTGWFSLLPYTHTHTHTHAHTHTPCRFVRYGHSISQPPPCGTGWFSLLPYTHTHTPCLCECMAILSPNPPPVEQDGFPFCSETHTHTHTHTSFIQHCLVTVEITPLPGCIAGGPSGVRYGCGTPVVGVLQASRLQALVFGGDTIGGGGGGEGTHSAQPYIPLRIPYRMPKRWY